MIDPDKYEYQSDFARSWVARGQVEGRAALVRRLLTVRFGPLTDDVRERIDKASIAELDVIVERLLSARTLQEALGQH